MPKHIIPFYVVKMYTSPKEISINDVIEDPAWVLTSKIYQKDIKDSHMKKACFSCGKERMN